MKTLMKKIENIEDFFYRSIYESRNSAIVDYGLLIMLLLIAAVLINGFPELFQNSF